MKKPPSPARTLSGQHQYARTLLSQGKHEMAAAYAKKCGFALTEVSIPKAQEEPVAIAAVPPDALEKTLNEIFAVADPAPTEINGSINGWPMETEAVVWRQCPNPRLWTIKLGDGRLCSMRRTSRNWRLNTRVKVKLTKPEGEPCYEAVGLATG